VWNEAQLKQKAGTLTQKLWNEGTIRTKGKHIVSKAVE
jgi:hypothetical protein